MTTTTTEEGVDFRIRNVHCEMSLDTIDDFDRIKYGQNIHKDIKVPSIRMFGICENGEKCLANIHGFLPYFFLRIRSAFSPDLKTYVGKLIVKCARLLDVIFIPGLPILADVMPFEIKDFYGFHHEKDHFIKIIFYDPILCHRIGLTLQKECGKNDLLQPYQVHIPYILQFFIEYDIAGMGLVRFRNARFRRISEDLQKKYPNFLRNPVKPNSYMVNEFDVFCDDIIVAKSPSMQSEYQISGLESLWKEEESRCRILNKELIREKHPETGVPEIKTEREERGLQNLYKAFTEFLTNDPNSSQVISDQRSDFTQTQAIFDAVDKAELSIYVQKAMENEDDEETWDRNERQQQYGDEEDEEFSDQAIQLEMTQLAAFEVEEPPIVDEFSDDEYDDKGKERLEEVEADYPPVLLEPCDVEIESSYATDYPNPRSNETWCPDKTIFKPKENITVTQEESPNKMTETQKAASEKLKNICSVANLTVLSLEALFLCNQETVNEKSDKASNKKYVPDPQKDPCIGIFFAIYKDVCNKFNQADEIGGCILEQINFKDSDFPGFKRVKSEGDIFRWLGMFLRKHDPDIIVGYDIKRFSFNYLIQRASILKIPSFNEDVSRLTPRWVTDYRSTLDDCKGRIFLNVWKIVRRENPMRHYRMSAVVNDILKRRFADMSQFFIEKLLKDNDENVNAIVLRHFLRKASINIQILVALDIFIRTSQMALVYGIQFTEVLTRGSQFRVESMLLRLTKLHEFCAPSISIEQRNSMPSPETIPLNLEPRSGIYYDPIVVLDFQSLYPSVCIAYNYCFSTCIGTVKEWEKVIKNKPGHFRLGALTSYEPPLVDYLATLQKENKLHVSPVGGIFVKKEVQKSLVASMLEELLETRVMVKTSMKKYKDEVLKRLLNARQLALKLIANVTYGYTAANWSGRMPCAEVADAIVSKGREALERAIKMIEEDVEAAYHGAQVVYGDTDSLFILMSGKTKDEAFQIGRKIADDVTALNPYPMKLKFEKVMMPCCLLAKKRYVGLSYEDEKDEEGVFDAKGIETVRRDSCKFVATSMEAILRKVFDHDFRGVMQYLRQTVENIDKIPLYEFILSGDYRGGYAESAVLPVKKIAEQLERISPFHLPGHGDRLEFLIAEPPPSQKTATVFSCVFRLDKFYEIPELKVHYKYYINRKLLPALSRIFQLMPLKINWFSTAADNCLGCDIQGELWCSSCIRTPGKLLNLSKAISKAEKTFVECSKKCRGCIKAHPTYYLNVPCYNVNCSVWHQRYKVQIQHLSEKIKAHPYHEVVKYIDLPNIIE